LVAGAAQISATGDVNVSRMSKDRLTGPGGFIDISSCTPKVFFMAPFTAGGLDVVCSSDDATLSIIKEGKVKKFVNGVYEKTFCGDEAVNRGQKVYYMTERGVFRRTNKHPVLELIEIAPGVDLQKDILDQMEFTPVISPDLKLMDQRIFKDEKMNAASDFFGSLEGKQIGCFCGFSPFAMRLKRLSVLQPGATIMKKIILFTSTCLESP
jgi:propionate CoA-transferase